MFDSIAFTKNYLKIGYPNLPADGDEYYLNLVEEYEILSGDRIGIGQDENGDVYVENTEAEKRFAQSLKNFFPTQDPFNKHGEVFQPSMLRLYYRSYLKRENYPQGSPAYQRITLFKQYENLSTAIERNNAENEIDLGWEMIAGQVDGDSNLDLESLNYDLEIINKIAQSLKDGSVDFDDLSIFENLYKLISDPKHKHETIKLLNSVSSGPSGNLYYLPKFGDLVSAAFGYGSLIFKNLITIWNKPNGDKLFYELIYNYPEEWEYVPDDLAQLVELAAHPRTLINDISTDVIQKSLDLIYHHGDTRNEITFLLVLLKIGSMNALNGEGKLARALNDLFYGSMDNSIHDQIFLQRLHQYLSNVDDDNLDPLIKRMIIASSVFNSNTVRSKIEAKVFDVIFTDRNVARKLVEMLEDPEEAEYMSDAENTGEYMIIRKKKNGTGGGENGSDPSSMPPASQTPSNPISSAKSYGNRSVSMFHSGFNYGPVAAYPTVMPVSSCWGLQSAGYSVFTGNPWLLNTATLSVLRPAGTGL